MNGTQKLVIYLHTFQFFKNFNAKVDFQLIINNQKILQDWGGFLKIHFVQMNRHTLSQFKNVIRKFAANSHLR